MDHSKGLYIWIIRKRTCEKVLAEQLRIAGLIGNHDSLIIGNQGNGDELLCLEHTDEILIGLAVSSLGRIVDGASRV